MLHTLTGVSTHYRSIEKVASESEDAASPQELQHENPSHCAQHEGHTVASVACIVQGPLFIPALVQKYSTTRCMQLVLQGDSA